MIKCNNSCPTGCFDGCCFECEKKRTCADPCEYHPSQCGESIIEDSNADAALELFQHGQMATIQKIAATVIAKKKLEEQEALMKEELKKAMERHGIKKFTSDLLNITYVEATSATSIDSAKLKKKYPEIAEECSKVSSRSAYVKVEVK